MRPTVFAIFSSFRRDFQNAFLFVSFMFNFDELLSEIQCISENGKRYVDLQNLLPNFAKIPHNSETELNILLSQFTH